MILAALLAAQAAAPPALAAAPTSPPTVRPASPRTLNGRFSCAATVYEVQVTTAPLIGTGAMLDRLAISGKPLDDQSLAEIRRMLGRLADVQSIEVRCRDDGAGELSIYGAQGAADAPARRARLRATLHRDGVADVAIAVAQR